MPRSTPHHLERGRFTGPKLEAGRSLVRENVKAVSTSQSTRSGFPHERGLIVSVDEVHHYLKISPVIDRNRQLLEVRFSLLFLFG
jgi:hypothetical protein